MLRRKKREYERDRENQKRKETEKERIRERERDRHVVVTVSAAAYSMDLVVKVRVTWFGCRRTRSLTALVSPDQCAAGDVDNLTGGLEMVGWTPEVSQWVEMERNGRLVTRSISMAGDGKRPFLNGSVMHRSVSQNGRAFVSGMDAETMHHNTKDSLQAETTPMKKTEFVYEIRVKKRKSKINV